MITYGTNPGMAIPITGVPASVTPEDVAALIHGARTGQALLSHPVDLVFIGSCTNSRMSDLRSAARVSVATSERPRSDAGGAGSYQ